MLLLRSLFLLVGFVLQDSILAERVRDELLAPEKTLAYRLSHFEWLHNRSIGLRFLQKLNTV